jgi:hypothetical protein
MNTAPRTAYPKAPNGPSPERRGVSRRTIIEEAKAKVPTIDLADRLVAAGGGGWRRAGERRVARCPLPGHEDRSPSFTVYPDGGWHCFGACQRGGDVVDLAQLAWAIDRADVAAAEVLLSFGHEVPARPPAWFARQRRQQPIRDAAEAERIEHVRDLVFRLICLPWLRQLPDETRGEAARSAWEKSLPLARQVYERRRRA